MYSENWILVYIQTPNFDDHQIIVYTKTLKLKHSAELNAPDSEITFFLKIHQRTMNNDL